LKKNEAAPTSPGRRIQVVVATSVMLSFISFWRAAAIVLNDLGSSAFYAGGIAEQAIGPSAPWFIFGVMLFSYAVRAVYVESCAMFTRGGVYRVVKEAMGSTLGRISVSALMFDYILTGPISGVSAGQYIVGLAARMLTYFGHPWHPDKGTVNFLSAAIAVLVTLYFWRRNTKGVHESSEDALKIMKVTTVMAVLLILWSTYTIVSEPAKRRLPPSPIPSHLAFNRDAVGWLPKLAPHALVPRNSELLEQKTEPKLGIPADHGFLLGLIGILIAFGHSVLAMSGEESLAQVNRELEYPKHKNLMRAGTVIFIYSLLFTSLVSFFAYAIIPDGDRSHFYDNLISGIAMNLHGPAPLKLFFHAFIVIVGFLMLSGAINTAIIGSNGVLNRVSEDGVLTDWFRAPHRKYGTTYRMINLIVLLQLLTIIGSGGNVYTLGEAYAFGVIWSFTFKGLAMLVLRFKRKEPREWKVPMNLRIGQVEIPIGLGIIALFIFLIAVVNLITKQIATVSGIAFTLIFYSLFWISERINKKKQDLQRQFALDKFTLNPKETISVQSLSVRPMNILCLVRDYQTLEHVKHALNRVDTHDRDLVIMTIRKLLGPDTGYENLQEQELFTEYEQLLFSRVVSLAEKAGKHVELLVIPSSNIFQAIAISSQQLNSSEIIAGRSSVMTPDQQARYVGQAWETLPAKPTHPVIFRVIDPQGNSKDYTLGAHAPSLKAEDIQLIHRLWLDLVAQPGNEDLHHRDVVTYALNRLRNDLTGAEREKILREIRAATSRPETPAA
jgi:amino acid transporter